MLLKQGSRGEAVEILQEQLNRLGFAVGPVDGVFGPITKSGVERFQRRYNQRHAKDPILVDGIVGPQTRSALESWEIEPHVPVPAPGPGKGPNSERDLRFSDALKLLLTADGKGCRYAGWSSTGIRLLEQVEQLQTVTVPRGMRIDPHAGISPPVHGATCSPFAGLFMGWLLNAHDFTWRIGRSAYWIANWTCHGVEYNGKVHRGFKEYCSVLGGTHWRSQSLGVLWDDLGALNMVNMVEMSHHCIFVLKVGGVGGMNVLDPWSQQPVEPGLYRFGADGHYVHRDGKKYYSGTRLTFRPVAPNEQTTQRWRVYRVADLQDDGRTQAVSGGCYHNNSPLSLALE